MVEEEQLHLQVLPMLLAFSVKAKLLSPPISLGAMAISPYGYLCATFR